MEGTIANTWFLITWQCRCDAICIALRSQTTLTRWGQSIRVPETTGKQKPQTWTYAKSTETNKGVEDKKQRKNHQKETQPEG